MTESSETTKVVSLFGGSTPNAIPNGKIEDDDTVTPKVILEQTLEANLSSVFVMGVTGDEAGLFFSSSIRSIPQMLYLLERAKQAILEA